MRTLTLSNGRRTDTPCPNDADIVAFVDADLSPEQLERVEKHIEDCVSCAKQVSTLRDVVRDLAAPPARELDVAEHVQSVMHRLDQAPPKPAEPRRTYWMGALLAAAAVMALFVLPRGELTPGVFTARGGHAQPALARDVGVQIYVRDASLQPLTSARRIKARAAFTAGLRNLGTKPAYLMLFAVDTQKAVHWIAPEYIVAGSDPLAVSIPASTSELPLPNSVVFDDVAAGTLRVVALITPKPLHVSQIESISVGELTEAGLKNRFAGAEVRQTVVEVTRE